MMQFHQGTLVVLKSGGPVMTVRETYDPQFNGWTIPVKEPGSEVRCEWFDDHSVHHLEWFPALNLALPQS